MKILKWILSLIPAAAIALSGGAVAKADTNTNDLPHFQEMLRVLRANLAGVTDDELNQAAVNGLLNQLYPRVMLVTNTAPTADSPGRVSRSALYDKTYGYIRVPEVGKGLAEQIASAYAGLTQTNQLKGLLLDLRFAGGVDYEAAAKSADLFLSKERPLLDWQDGTAHSTAKANAIKVPSDPIPSIRSPSACTTQSAAYLKGGASLPVYSPGSDFADQRSMHFRHAANLLQNGTGRSQRLFTLRHRIPACAKTLCWVKAPSLLLHIQTGLLALPVRPSAPPPHPVCIRSRRLHSEKPVADPLASSTNCPRNPNSPWGPYDPAGSDIGLTWPPIGPPSEPARSPFAPRSHFYR